MKNKKVNWPELGAKRSFTKVWPRCGKINPNNMKNKNVKCTN